MASKAAEQTIRAGANAAHTHGTNAARAAQQTASYGAKAVGTIIKNEAKAMVPRLEKVATGAALMTALGFTRGVIDTLANNEEDKEGQGQTNTPQTNTKKEDDKIDRFSSDTFNQFVMTAEDDIPTVHDRGTFKTEAKKLAKNLTESYKKNISLFEPKNINADTHPAVQNLSSAPVIISLASMASTLTGNPKIGAAAKTTIETVTDTVPQQIWALTHNTGYYYGCAVTKTLKKAVRDANKKHSLMTDVDPIRKKLNGQVTKGDDEKNISPSPTIPRIKNSENGRGK